MRKVLILGDGPSERAWAQWFRADPDSEIAAVFPAINGETLDEINVAEDLDAALAVPGVNLVIVGGPLEFRGEALRRAAAEGLAIICIHPPGVDSEAYYQVSLAHTETGAIVVPDLVMRLHPGVERLRHAIKTSELGGFRSLRHEFVASPGQGDLAREVFSRLVDVIRSLLGEIETVSASGDPAGVNPELELVVQHRGAEGIRAEVRTWRAPQEPARLTLNGATGSLTLEYDDGFQTPATLIRRVGGLPDERIATYESWDPHLALLQAVETPTSIGPTLIDGTRATELSEAVVRSLRRGRTIDLHYETISEESTFKSVMTSTGCMILLGVLFLLPVSLAGPPLGMPWTIYLAYAIPPVLLAFVMSQLLRFGISQRREREKQFEARDDAARSSKGTPS